MRISDWSSDVCSSDLCARLTSASRHTPGWDFLQFKREEPDDTDGRRSIDLAVAPSGSVIWIEGRQYTEYQTLLPIECKRLPTPTGTDRDEREYLYSRFRSEEHTSELQSLMSISYAVFCLTNKIYTTYL